MKKTAQILCFILAMVFVLSLLPMNAFAAELETPAPAAETASAVDEAAPAAKTGDKGVTEENTDSSVENKDTETPAPEANTPVESPAPDGDKEAVEPPAETEKPAVTPEKSVAQVGEVYYTTLQEAVNAANDEEVILTKDVDITNGGIRVSGHVTLELAGHTITASNSKTGNISITDNSTLVLCDSNDTGKIKASVPYGDGCDTGVVVASGENAEFIMSSGTIETAFDDAVSNGQFAVVLLDGADMVMEGGKINAGWYAIAGNGNNDTQDTRITICGGELYSTADYAVYLPQSGTTEICKKDDNTPEPVIKGAAGGIAIRRGTLNISAGTVVSENTGSTGEGSDGTTGLANAAVNVEPNYGDVTLNITGGTFTANGEAVSLIKGDGSHAGNVTVTGGSFSSNPDSAFVPFGYEAVEANGVFTVGRAQKIVTKDENGVTVVDGLFNGTEQPVPAGTTGETKIAPHTVQSIANAGASFTATSGTTAVTFDSKAMNKAGGQAVSICIKDAGDVEGTKAAYSLEFTAGGANLLPEGSTAEDGTVTVSIAKPADVAEPQVWYVVNGVFVENMNAKAEGENLVFTTNHLSTYAVTDGAPAKSAIVKYVDKKGVEVYDDSLTNAVNNVQPNGTITLLHDVENGEGVIVPEGSSFTLDFANHTYTVTDKLAGSEGTKSQCFQLLKDSTITMKNGTVVANNPQLAMIIQNYSNLTLDNMVLDATKGENRVSYVVSNNNGDTKITNGTQIIAKDGAVAFDVCSFSSYPAVKVTVDNATIKGDVEFTGMNNEQYNSELDITGGSFNGSIKAEEKYDRSAVKVSGGNFTADPTAFVAADSAVAEIAKDEENKFYVGEENIKNAASTLGKGDTVTVNQGNVALGELPHGVEVINKGDGVVSANNNTVPKGESLVSCNHPEIKEVAERPATCKEEGMKAHWQCVGADGCGKLFKKNEDGSFTMLTKDEEDALVIPLADHKLDKVEVVQPTCGKEGVKEHWHCSVCEKNFSDEAGKNEVTDKDLAIPVEGNHKLVEVKEVKATCTVDGVKAHWHCEGCGKNYADSQGMTALTDEELKIPATGHNPGIWRDNDEQHWRVCRNCGEKLDLADHSYGEWVITREPTERLSGRRERECTVCGYIDRDRIPATHGPKTADESNLVLWATLLSLSAVAATGTAVYMGYKKKHNK